ncbi:MAG: hypothetical protein HOJ48_09955 [Desulfobacula sp.]|jgi:hypothetical protein|nr:hypothetical protein [Desulfobacula sp.]
MKPKYTPKLIYGERDGQPVSISDVPSGLACNCVCPECKTPLIARIKDDKRQKHFAHSADVECSGGVETSLHLLAKDMMLRYKAIVLPGVNLVDPRIRKQYLFHQQRFRISSADLETKYGDIIPDVLLDIYGVKVAVEIFVTHKLDQTKIEQFRRMSLPAIEIDLSWLDRDLPEIEIAKHVIEAGRHKRWVSLDYPTSQKLLRPPPLNVKRHVETQISFVAGCSIKKQKWNGQKYSTPEDCQKCEFYLGQSNGRTLIYCAWV